MADNFAVDAIRAIPALANIETGARIRIAELLTQSGKVLSLDVGEVLIHEGDVGGGAGFVLLEGSMSAAHEGHAPIVIEAPALLGEMHQFNPQALRTATVTADTPCRVLRFGWFEFNLAAQATLPAADQHAFMEAMEQLVWQRFQHEEIFNVAAFATLDAAARLKLCLTLVWLAREETHVAGTSLFEAGQPQGGVGLLLLSGAVRLTGRSQAQELMQAPCLLGIATEFDPDRKWTASAKTERATTLLRFDWAELEAYLQQRISPAETARIFAEIESATPEGFRH